MTAVGVGEYPTGTAYLPLDEPMTIAVTGGSMSYFGATGQVASAKITEAGEYTHTFKIYAYKGYGPKKHQGEKTRRWNTQHVKMTMEQDTF